MIVLRNVDELFELRPPAAMSTAKKGGVVHIPHGKRLEPSTVGSKKIERNLRINVGVICQQTFCRTCCVSELQQIANRQPNVCSHFSVRPPNKMSANIFADHEAETFILHCSDDPRSNADHKSYDELLLLNFPELVLSP